MYHRQCELKRGSTTRTSWLPERYARVGRVVRLKDGGVWEDGWVVVRVFDRLESGEVVRRSGDYRRSRRSSDI